MTDRFNSDTEALKSRADLNAANAKHDLERWLLGLIPPVRGLRILDLGCGVGKQIFRLAPLVTRAGSILGVDLSADAVRAVNERARAEDLGFIEARQMALDDCVASLTGSQFDLVLSSYAIYYSRDLVALLRKLRLVLSRRGTVFVCGPARGTNREIIQLVNGLVRGPAEQLKTVEGFLAPAQIEAIARDYAHHTVATLDNEVAFDSTHSVLAWWRNHNSFVPSVATEVQQNLHAHFLKQRLFVLTKNVLGVRFDV